MLCRTRISFPPSSGLGLLKTPTMNHCWLTWKLLKKKTCLQNKPLANGVASPVIHSRLGNVFSGSHTSRSSKKGPCLWEESAFFESFKHQNRSVFASETCTKLKKDTVDVQFSFKRILLWDISTLPAHPLKKYPLSGGLFSSAHTEGTIFGRIWSFHGLENCQTERTQGHLQCIETLAGMRVRGKKYVKHTISSCPTHTTLLINFFTQNLVFYAHVDWTFWSVGLQEILNTTKFWANNIHFTKLIWVQPNLSASKTKIVQPHQCGALKMIEPNRKMTKDGKNRKK